ncbi:MAG: hypothetical protein ACTHJ3_04375 [Pararhizobium sp.]
MQDTVSKAVHAAVQSSKFRLRPLYVHESALQIARNHGIDHKGVWLIEQALMMVGSRAGVGMKLGRETLPHREEAPVPRLIAANSN